ncbi:MAG: glycosyltransferase [Sporichthyaceae bacterium]
MAKVCLNMIVKDEARILRRCLAAAAPHIDCYVIADTGSTDGTPELIRALFDETGIPGEVVHTTFTNFEQARNEALAAARASSQDFDYVLLCDADMELRVTGADYRAALSAPGYYALQRNTISYANLRLLRRDVPARYVGVTHEYVDLGGLDAGMCEGIWFYDHAEGSSRAVKYERDIALLRGALAADPANARHVFYLAQSYRDAGQLAQAAEAYRRRAGMGGFAEEVFVSLLEAARLRARLGADESEVIADHLAAWRSRPQRAEALVSLATHLREHENYVRAHEFARQAIAIPRPPDILFVEDATYTWRALDEYAISAYWTGHPGESRDACRRLLASPHLPADQRGRVRENLDYAEQALDRASRVPGQSRGVNQGKAARRKPKR